MIKMKVLNFIPYIVNKKKNIQQIKNRPISEILKIVRDSCSNKGNNIEEWSKSIVTNCIIPKSHPFLEILGSKNIPLNHPLRVLGAIAYGTETSWIVIENIKWEDGTISYPEQENKFFYLKVKL